MNSLIKIGLAGAALSLPLAAAPIRATEPAEVLESSYALWGMMDAMANYCWERSGYDVSYMEGHQNWLARNVFIRDEIDAARAVITSDDSVVASGEKAGSDGILEIMGQASNPDEACANWLNEVNAAKSFEAEAFLVFQLGILRERSGM